MNDVRLSMSNCNVYLYNDTAPLLRCSAKTPKQFQTKVSSRLAGRHGTIVINYQLFFQKLAAYNCSDHADKGRKWIKDTVDMLLGVTDCHLESQTGGSSNGRSLSRSMLLSTIAGRGRAMCWFAATPIGRYNPRGDDYTKHTVLSCHAGLGNLVEPTRCEADRYVLDDGIKSPESAWRPVSPAKPLSLDAYDERLLMLAEWKEQFKETKQELKYRRTSPPSSPVRSKEPSRPLWSPVGASRGIPDLPSDSLDEALSNIGRVTSPNRATCQPPQSPTRQGRLKQSPSKNIWRPTSPSKKNWLGGLDDYDRKLFAGNSNPPDDALSSIGIGGVTSPNRATSQPLKSPTRRRSPAKGMWRASSSSKMNGHGDFGDLDDYDSKLFAATRKRKPTPRNVESSPQMKEMRLLAALNIL